LSRDSTQVGDGIVKTCTGPDSPLDGGSISYNDTPAAGTHTYFWKLANQGVGNFQMNSARIYVEALSR